MATLFFCELISPARSALLLVQLLLLFQLVLLVQLVQLVQLVLLAKAHKILVFVLGKPENGGPEGRKRTKNLILCSKRPKTGVPDPKSAQKPLFCARNARKRGFRTPKAHKNPDFVLGKPVNLGNTAHSDTKMPFLCSGRLGLAPGRGEISIERDNNGLPANHRAHFKNISI